MECSHYWQHHHPPVRLLPRQQADNDDDNDDDDNDNDDSKPHTTTTNRLGQRERRKRVFLHIPKVSKRLLFLLAFWLLVLDGVPDRQGVAHAFVSVAPKPATANVAAVVGPKHHFFPNQHQQQQQPRTTTAATIAVGVSTATTVLTEIAGYADYAPAATSLFNNMKLPAAVVTAGMISLGFATSFPVLPRVRPTNQEPYPDHLRARCESLQRLHIVVALIAVTSEIVVVLWSAVAVNQLTEKSYAPAWSVWDLLQRDCDLAWSAVNSHFILGIIGFVTMLALRAYVMLLALDASYALMTAASSGTGAALCLMVSIVNRGVESGGGDGYRYGTTIYDLFEHYAVLLYKAATSGISPGPLQLSAIVLEITSLVFMANVLVFQNGQIQHDETDIKTEHNEIDQQPRRLETTAATFSTTTNGDQTANDKECPVIDIIEVVGTNINGSGGSSSSTDETNNNSLRVVVGRTEPFFASTIQRNNEATRAKVARCLAIEEETTAITKKASSSSSSNNNTSNTSKQRQIEIDDEDTSVSFY